MIPTFEECARAMAWVYENIPEQVADGRAVKVRMFGGVLDGQMIDGRGGTVPPVIRYQYETAHPMLDEVVVTQVDEWIPSFFVPLSYCFYRTVRL